MTITRSGAWRSRSRASPRPGPARPGLPTTSPMNRTFTARSVSDRASGRPGASPAPGGPRRASGRANRSARSRCAASSSATAPGGAARRQLQRPARRAAGGDRAQRRRQDDAALDPRRDPPRRRGRGPRAAGEIGWVPQQAALYRRLTVAENLRLFARLERSRGRRGQRSSGCSSRPASPSAATIRSRRSRAATSSGSTSRSGCWPSRRCCCSTSPATGLDPRQRARLWEFVLGLAGARDHGDLLDPQHRRRPSATASACWCSPTARRSSTAPPAELHAPRRRARTRRATSRRAFVAFLRERGH